MTSHTKTTKSIKLTIFTKFEIEVSSQEELTSAVEKMPWLKNGRIGMTPTQEPQRQLTETAAVSRLEADKQAIIKAVGASVNLTQAALKLKISRQTLNTLIRKYNLHVTTVHTGTKLINRLQVTECSSTE